MRRSRRRWSSTPRRLRPGQLAKAGARLLAILDPDGPEPADREYERRREVSLGMRADGSAALSGELTPAAAAGSVR